VFENVVPHVEHLLSWQCESVFLCFSLLGFGFGGWLGCGSRGWAQLRWIVAATPTCSPGCRWTHPAFCGGPNSNRPGTPEPVLPAGAARATALCCPADEQAGGQGGQPWGAVRWGGAGGQREDQGQWEVPCGPLWSVGGVPALPRRKSGRQAGRRAGSRATCQDGVGQVLFSDGDHGGPSFRVPQHASLPGGTKERTRVSRGPDSGGEVECKARVRRFAVGRGPADQASTQQNP